MNSKRTNFLTTIFLVFLSLFVYIYSVNLNPEDVIKSVMGFASRGSPVL